ncbi:DNA gyrase inhibitor YacG [Ketogulonicigenium vulgare]|uniref:DNA gyrase inhibitor YacG n=1 Tax=Ketogulonicigenium vulgare TaxID=92945 RepID=UPI0023587FF9|nr:DNA gyrase inhibitor YacG [Ketogulonicigenium vulgare]
MASKCPICGKATVAEYKPFCSARCADVDLGRWLGGNYRIASEDSDEQEEALQELEKLIDSEFPPDGTTRH